MKRNPAGSFLHQSNIFQYLQNCCPFARPWPAYVVDHILWNESIREMLSDEAAQPKPKMDGFAAASRSRPDELRVVQ